MVAPVFSRSCRIARGIGSELKTIGTPRDERRDKIAESVRVRERNDREIAIRASDSHRFTNVVTIGKQLFAAKANQAGFSCRSGGKFEKCRRPSVPVSLGALVTDRDRIIALLRAD